MPGRPLVISRQERNGHRRARYQALWLLQRGHTLSEVSQTVGVDYRTVPRWVAWYRQDGLDAVIRRTPMYAAPGQPSRLTPEQIDQLPCAAHSEGKGLVR